MASWSDPLDVGALAHDSVDLVCRAVESVAASVDVRVSAVTDAALLGRSFTAIETLRIAGRPSAGWAPWSGFWPTADGWVRLHANYPHHAAAIRDTFGVVDDAGLAAALSKVEALAVEERLHRAGGVGVAVRTPQEWSHHPQAVATAGDPWCHVADRSAPSSIPWRRRQTRGPFELTLLKGLRVLDLTRVVAGPVCTQLLACLGAEVIRIDPPARPELLDHYLATGMGKRSAQVDLTRIIGGHNDASAFWHDLILHADVVVLGYRPGSLDRFGLSPSLLHDRYPNTVVAALSAWGEQGPWTHHRGFDSIVQAATGIAALCSDPQSDHLGRRPGSLPVQALDYTTGYRLAADILTLVAAGHGGLITANLVGAARALLSYPHPSPPILAAELAQEQAVSCPSPYGPLEVAPPAVRVNKKILSAPLTRYGEADLCWDGLGAGVGRG